MKFGIFYELQLPRPWTADSEYQLFQDALSQFELADKLGYDYAWVVEHHFLEEYSHCSAPEIFLTAIAAQTKRIRVGHGINVCVPEINPVIRIAERCAVLDIVSGGRLEVGTGRSATWTELPERNSWLVRDSRAKKASPACAFFLAISSPVRIQATIPSSPTASYARVRVRNKRATAAGRVCASLTIRSRSG